MLVLGIYFRYNNGGFALSNSERLKAVNLVLCSIKYLFIRNIHFKLGIPNSKYLNLCGQVIVYLERFVTRIPDACSVITTFSLIKRFVLQNMKLELKNL